MNRATLRYAACSALLAAWRAAAAAPGSGGGRYDLDTRSSRHAAFDGQ